MIEIKQNPRVVRAGDVFSVDGVESTFEAKKGHCCEDCDSNFQKNGNLLACSKMPDSCRFNTIIYKRCHENR